MFSADIIANAAVNCKFGGSAAEDFGMSVSVEKEDGILMKIPGTEDSRAENAV